MIACTCHSQNDTYLWVMTSTAATIHTCQKGVYILCARSSAGQCLAPGAGDKGVPGSAPGGQCCGCGRGSQPGRCCQQRAQRNDLGTAVGHCTECPGQLLSPLPLCLGPWYVLDLAMSSFIHIYLIELVSDAFGKLHGIIDVQVIASTFRLL